VRQPVRRICTSVEMNLKTERPELVQLTRRLQSMQRGRYSARNLKRIAAAAAVLLLEEPASDLQSHLAS
jgi:hypothetical protein